MSQFGNNKKILLTGSYGMGNTGDEAILASILNQLHTRLPGAHITVVAGNPQTIRDQFGVETVRWDSWLDIIATVKQSDLIIQGGGGLFFDYGGLNFQSLIKDGAPDLAHFGSYALLAKLYNKPFTVYACGVGPLFTEEGREMTRVVFSLADRATVRDEESRAVLESTGIDGASVQVTADPAFSMPVADSAHVKALLEKHGIKPGKPLIAVTPRPWDYEINQEQWEMQLAKGLADFAAETDAQLLLIPFHQGYDDATTKRLQDKLPGSDVRILEGNYTVSELAGIIGQSDLLVGMRLHSVLFAIMTGTPAVALVYDPKVRNLVRRVGHEELCLNLNELTRLSSTLSQAWQQSAELRADFLRSARELKTLSDKNADNVCQLLELALPEQESSDAAFHRILAHIIEGRLNQISASDDMHRTQEQNIRNLNAELEAIHHSKAWQLIRLYRKLRALI